MSKKIILVAILVLAAILRLWRLSSFPSGLNADEAALGYNAYSLLLTGKDEHGISWPVNLESFGDFKPAFYAYLLIPFVKVLGLTEFAVRLPSALAGIISVALIYLLVREVFLSPEIRTGTEGEVLKDDEIIPLFSALLLAISPWALHFSRGAWEVNVATMFILAGVWFFLKWLKNSRLIFLIPSTLSFVLSMYTYQSARLIAPLIGVGLVVLFFKRIFSHPKQIIIGGLLLALILLPLANSILHSDATSRLTGVGLLADLGPLNRVKELRGQHSSQTALLAKILHNRPVIYTIQFIKNYTDHWNGNFLFINGDTISRNRVPETGLLYLTDAVFLLLGAIFLLRHPSPFTKIIWLWLLIAPVASGLTFQTPNALRSQNMIIPLTLMISSGIYYFLQFIPTSHRKLLQVTKPLALSLLIIIYTWQFARYLHEYYVHYPKEYPAAWEYGFRQLVPYVNSVVDRYSRILITDKYDQPYILFLFYSQYPPQLFQGHHQLTFRDQFNFSTVRDYGKFHFAATPWDSVRDIHSSLIVAAPEDIPAVGVNIVKTITFPGGSPAFKIVSN